MSKSAYSIINEQRRKAKQVETKTNAGGLLGGIGYTGEKIVLGTVQSIEGAADYVVGGVADLFGADEYAEQVMQDDWMDYGHADQWYNPSGAMKVVGDVAGGIGSTLPTLAAAAGAAALTYATGGAAAPLAIKALGATAAPLMAGLGAAGNATKEAYQETGNLSGKEWGYGALVGATEAGVEYLSAGIGTGTGRIAKSLGKSATGEAARTAGKYGVKSVLKTLGADMVSEGFEEGLATAVAPLWARMTYDPDAENATWGEIGYDAFIGAMSGLVLGGAHQAISYTGSVNAGRKVSEAGKADKLVRQSKYGLAQIRADMEQSKAVREAADAADGGVIPKLKLKSQLKTTAKNREAAAQAVEQALARWEALSPEQRNSRQGYEVLGDLQRNDFLLRANTWVEDRVKELSGQSDEALQNVAQQILDATGETYTVEDLRADKNDILSRIAVNELALKGFEKTDTETTTDTTDKATPDVTAEEVTTHPNDFMTEEVMEDEVVLDEGDSLTEEDMVEEVVEDEDAYDIRSAVSAMGLDSSYADLAVQAYNIGGTRGLSATDFARSFATAVRLGESGAALESLVKVPMVARLDNSTLQVAYEMGQKKAERVEHSQKTPAKKTEMDEVEQARREVRATTTQGYGTNNAQEVALVEEAKKQKIPQKAISAMLQSFRQGTALTPEQFAKAWAQAIHFYGRYGISQGHIRPNTALALLTPEQRQTALAYAKAITEVDREARQTTADTKKAPRVKRGAKSGVVRVEKGMIIRNLSDEQYAAYKAAEIIANATGTDVMFHQNLGKVGGKQVYGYYDPETGTLHININAMRDGKHIALYTLAHETTHYIKEWSPSKFDALADFVMKRLGVDAQTAIMDKLSALRSAGLIDGSMTIQDAYDLAYEEVIADGMEGVLADGTALDALAKHDKTLWEKIKAWISGVISKIKKAYGDLSHTSKTAQVLAETMESLESMEQLFYEAVVDAGERRKTASQIDSTGTQGNTHISVIYKVAEENADSSIKQQIKAYAEQIDAMSAVASVSYRPMNKKQLHQEISANFKRIGYRVDRQNFGVIEIGEKQISQSINYINTEAEKAALFAVPAVLKRGEIISGHEDHKGRGYDTITIAAPIEVNGKRGVVGVVVTQISNRNQYRVHRILTPDGSEFVFESQNENAELTSGDPLSSDKLHPSALRSYDSIPQTDTSVKPKFSLFSETDTTYMDTVSRGDITESSLHAERAVEVFGLTNDLSRAGFVLPSGQMPNLSEYGLPGVQHKRIEQVFEDPDAGDPVNRFIQEGNVRLNASAPGIELSSDIQPTVAQYNVISKLISRGMRDKGIFYVDMTDGQGDTVASVTYDTRDDAQSILYDLKNYYRRGVVPQNELRYSVSDDISESGAEDSAGEMTESSFSREDEMANESLTASDLDAYMRTGKTQHTRNKKSRMLEAGKSPILTSAEETAHFIANIIRGQAVGEVRAFGRVGKRLADAIQSIRKSLELRGGYLELSADALRESYKRHSTPKEPGDISLSEMDFQNIPQYLNDFDGVLSVDTHNNRTEVHIFKETPDGYIKILTVVSGERDSLQVTKLIGISKEKFDRKYGKKIERVAGSSRGQIETSIASIPSTKARHTAGTLSNDSIPQDGDSVNRRYSISENSPDPETQIMVGMSDSERAEILRRKKITPTFVEIHEGFDVDWVALEHNRWDIVKKPLLKKMRELGYLTHYRTDSVDVEFDFTGEGFRKSMNSQVSDYGGTLADFAKVVMNMQGLLDSAVLIEVHADKAQGTPKANAQLLQTYVLLSAYQEGTQITPVQFEIKQYVDEQNRLYLAVAMTKIEADVISDTILDKNQASTRLLPASTHSIADFVRKINPHDENFFKYIPDEFLTAEQREAKQRAIAKENAKYGRRYSFAEEPQFPFADAERRMNERDADPETQGVEMVEEAEQEEEYDFELLAFFDSVSSMVDKNAASKRKKRLGIISQDHADIVADAMMRDMEREIDVSGYELWIDGSAVLHIQDKHGEDGTSDTSMSDGEDIARIAWAANHADYGYVARKQNGQIDYSQQYKDKNDRPAVKVILEKMVGDDIFVVAECVPDTVAKRIHIVSARIEKGGNGQVLDIEPNGSPQPTSETPLDGNATNGIVSQDGDSVNRRYSISENSPFADAERRMNERDASSDPETGDIAEESTSLAKMLQDEVTARKEKETVAVLDEINRRVALANALMSAVQSQDEYVSLKEYRQEATKYALTKQKIDERVRKVADLNKELQELYKLRKEADPERIGAKEWVADMIQETQTQKDELLAEIADLEKTLNRIDQRLFRLWAAKPLGEIIARERKRANAMERSAQRARERADRRVAEARRRQEFKVDEAWDIARERIGKERAKRIEKVSEARYVARQRVDAMRNQRQMTETDRKTRRVIGQLYTMLFDPTKSKHVPADLKQLVENALSMEQADFRTLRDKLREMARLETDIDILEKKPALTAKERDRLDKMLYKYSALAGMTIAPKEQAKMLYTAFKQYQKEAKAKQQKGFDEEIMEYLEEQIEAMEDKPLSEMSLDSQRAVWMFYKQLYHQVNTANKLFTEERDATLEGEARTIMQEMFETKAPAWVTPKKGEPAVISSMRKYLWQLLKPVNFFDMLGSDTFSKAFMDLHRGTGVWAMDVVEGRKKRIEISKKYGFDKWDLNERFEVETSNGKRVKISLGQIMSIYAYSRREQALDHLEFGGFTFAPNATYKGKYGDEGAIKRFAKELDLAINDSERYTLDAPALGKIISRLTAEQKAFVEAMQSYLSVEMAAKGNAVSRALYDMDLFGESSYFPIKVASEYIDSETGKVGDPKVKNKGFTKSAKERAKEPLILGDFMEVWTGHINDMALYHGMVLPMENMNRLLNFRPSEGMSGASETTVYAFKKYTEHQIQNWSQSKRIVVYESMEQFGEFIRTAREDNQYTKKMYFGAIPTDLAQLIKSRTGVSVEDYNCSLGANEIRKIFKSHGNERAEASRGQRAITENDMLHIPDVILSPDSIELSPKQYEGKPVITFTKVIDGSQMTVSAVVSDKHLDLFVQTAFVSTKKGNLATQTGEQAPIDTPEATRGTVSTNSIPQNPQNSNTSVQNSSGIEQYSSMKELIRQKYGADAVSYIEQLLRDLNGGARSAAPMGLVDKGLSLFKKSAVMASMSVIIQQPSSIARACALVDKKYFAHMAGFNFKDSRAMYEELKKYAPVAIIKEMGGFDTGVGQTTADYIMAREYEWRDKPKALWNDPAYRDSVLGYGAAKADQMAWLHLWEAVKKETADKHRGMDVKSEEFLKIAGERFEEVIIRTQVYDSTLSRSAMMRSKDTVWKMVTAFMAEPTTVVNMLISGAVGLQRGDKKGFRRTVASVSAALILNAVLASIVYAARDDDEEKNYGEKYVSALVEETADAFNPLATLPYVKDIMSLIQGYEVERSDMAVYADLINAINGMASSEKSWLDKSIDLGANVGTLFGLPTRNIQRDARGIYNVLSNAGGDGSTSRGMSVAVQESLRSMVPFGKVFGIKADISNGYQLYDAMVSGDTAHESRVLARFETTTAANTALRTALRDKDARIRQAAQARYEGDMATYSTLVREVKAEGIFTQDMIVSAVNAEMNAIKKDYESGAEDNADPDATSEETVEGSVYAVSDLNSELDAGDYTEAKSIMTDMVNARMAQGKTKAQAQALVKSGITRYWKEKYLAAYKAKNTAECKRIRTILKQTGLYGTASEILEVTQDWVKSTTT